MLLGSQRKALLIDISWKKLALNALGKTVDIVPRRAIRLLLLAFNFVFKQIIENLDEETGYKKLAILPSMLFIDPGKQFQANLVVKVYLILADDFSQLTIGNFMGNLWMTQFA